jgi:hypothetical protein
MTTKLLWLGLAALALSLLFALAGAVLAKMSVLRFKSGPRYAQLCATVIMGASWWMAQSSRFQVGLDAISLGALLVSVWVVGYIVVWASVGYTLTTVAHVDSGTDSSILTAMFPATQQQEDDFQATQMLDPRDPK